MTAINTPITYLMYYLKQIVPATHTACVFTILFFFFTSSLVKYIPSVPAQCLNVSNWQPVVTAHWHGAL